MAKQKQKGQENLLAFVVIASLIGGAFYLASKNPKASGDQVAGQVEKEPGDQAEASGSLKRKHTINVGEAVKVTATSADGISINSSSSLDNNTLKVKIQAAAAGGGPIVEVEVELVIDGHATPQDPPDPPITPTNTPTPPGDDLIGYGFLELIPVWVGEIDDPDRDATLIKLSMAHIAAQGDTPAAMLASVQRGIVGILGEGDNRKRWKPFFDRLNTRLNKLKEKKRLNTAEDYRAAFLECAAGFRRAAK